MDYIYLNCIRYDYSIADGPGLRTLIFMQGCDLRCPFCQNEKIWDIKGGYKLSIKKLIKELKKNSITKKVTITGGEPLFQLKALETLVDELYKEQFNIVLYTGHRKEDVPKGILSKINYLKYGPFIYSKRTSTIPFIGSSNQVFEKLR